MPGLKIYFSSTMQQRTPYRGKSKPSRRAAAGAALKQFKANMR